MRRKTHRQTAGHRPARLSHTLSRRRLAARRLAVLLRVSVHVAALAARSLVAGALSAIFLEAAPLVRLPAAVLRSPVSSASRHHRAFARSALARTELPRSSPLDCRIGSHPPAHR